MTRKKKIICSLFVTLVVLAVILYVAANVALDRVSRRLMTDVAAKAEKKGLGVAQPSFDSVRLSGTLSPAWSGLRAIVSGSPHERGPEWDLQVERATLGWGFDSRANLIVWGMTLSEISEVPEDRKFTDRKIVIDRINCQLPFNVFHPNAVILEVLQEGERIVSDGTTIWPLEIDGKIICSVKNKPVELRLNVVPKGDENSLALIEEDVVALSPLFGEKLTQAEVKLISSHPLRASRLLQLKDEAETKSSRSSEKDPSVPQDAYRHILWSYLLKEAYGVEFAEQVGSAHEMGDTGNTEAEREMDLHNNAIGRKYAEEGIRENEVLQHLMSDPEVRREP
ncbi:DUF6973 domain-containing protein [Bythopirellula goksoeyrii]|uniref:DUF6973 domain-containing protein n=1 Tax=Bythopirellula goksoeyrii TaxID=1400387 RepID=A0A5B9Q591_9BACT|nr:hypothetical protein [Bythopirellula goksoeyrii]QEG32839.1 hypothetical protein Pr1d_01000 [Bythopirellula goksoeyrii]